MIGLLELDTYEQVNSHVPSYSSSTAKGALGRTWANGLGSTLPLSRVVIGWFYELVAKILRATQGPVLTTLLPVFGSEDDCFFSHGLLTETIR